MDYKTAINRIMNDVKDGSAEPFIIYRDKDGWHCDYTQNQYGDTFDWVKDVQEQDPLAITLCGKDFSQGSAAYVYDTVLCSRIKAEYYAAAYMKADDAEFYALRSFFEDNVSVFSQKTTDYLTTLERPLAALQEMCPFSMTTDKDGWGFDEALAYEAIDHIENEVNDRLRSYPEETGPEKRYIDGYTEKISVNLAEKTVVFAENSKAAEPYLICNIKYDNPLNMEERYDAAVTGDYVEAIREFAKRIDNLAGTLEAERQKRGLPFTPLTAADCVPGGLDTDLTNKVIIIKSEALIPEYRAADYQLKIAMRGFGCAPDSRGSAVFCKDVYSGRENRFERMEVLGVADMERLPEWAKKKLALMEALKEPGVFEYGGYHFKPVRQFKKGEVDKRLDTDSRSWKKDEQFAMRNMSSDFDLNIRNQNSNGKTDYTNEKFYAASGGSEADIFVCIENGKLYVPGVNELFRYNEPPQRSKSTEKKPSLLGKLDDNKQKVERGKAERTDKPVTKKAGDLEGD